MEAVYGRLENWKSQLRPRRIDLVGDYAGRELFIVEGDSLLRQALSDERIDMEDGFQLLHLVYVVESFLLNLKKRGCNFHLVFFEENKYNSFMKEESNENSYKYLFSRQAIIQHLVNTSKAEVEAKSETGTGFRIFQFKNPYHDDFEQYLEATRPYFVMCHQNEGMCKRAKFLMTGFVWRMIMADYNVAWINTVEFRDCKVIISIVQGGPKVLIRNLPARSREAYNLLARAHSHDSYDYKFSEICTGQVFTERELMAVASISALLRRENTDSKVAKSDLVSFLLHVALLNHLSLPQRHIAPAPTGEIWPTIGSITRQLIVISCHLLSDKGYLHAASQLKSRNIHDFIDGRLLVKLEHGLKGGVIQLESIPEAVISDFTRLAEVIETSCGYKVLLEGLFHLERQSPLRPSSQKQCNELINRQINQTNLEVLPFSNPTFDTFLSQIKLNIDSLAALQEVDYLKKEMSDRDKWKINRINQSNRNVPVWKPSTNKWIAGRARIREQWSSSDMTKYAASLIGAKGKILEPIVITNGPPNLQSSTQPAPEVKTTQRAKKERPLSKKEIIRAENNKKLVAKGDLTLLRIWKTLCGDIQEITDDLAKISQLEQFLDKINATLSEKGDVVNCEVRIYKVFILQRFWTNYCREGKREDGYDVVAKIFSEVKVLLGSKGLTKEIHKILANLFESLGISLPPRLITDPLLESRPSFKMPWNGNSLIDTKLQMSSTEFQLLHCGQYMDRDMDSKPDPRVSFEPDGWQREVLDEIDRNNSVFVVAPTSAGKTFISFYAMEKILRSGDDDVLVYVAPNKALVNQVAAEVLGRFQKRYPHAGKSVWAIHTRDRRVGNPTGCQILITVPHILQIMLLAPSNADSWSRRVKRIIFDEIHCIGQVEDGAVWEQLIMLSPCPIIALSATVGNPEEFSKWMKSTQNSLGIKLKMVQHHYRYSDLRKMLYVEPKDYNFTGLIRERKFPRLESSSSFIPIHPVSSLVDASRGMSDDLALEPRDCLSLYRAMKERSTEKYPLEQRLDPETYFSKFPIIHKVNVIRWETELKTVLRHWMESSNSPFNGVVQKLMGPLSEEPAIVRQRNQHQINSYPTKGGKQSLEGAIEAASNLPVLLKSTLPLLDELNKKGALPAIVFSHDRAICEKLCGHIAQQLASAESEWRKTDVGWNDTLRKWEEYKEIENNSFTKKKAKSDAKNFEGSKAEKLREETSKESSFFDSFNPKIPSPQFSFADNSKHRHEEFMKELRFISRFTLPVGALDALRRGIGIHHSGLNRHYRQLVEILFRKGFLRVVIATGTLSLGINMPCKTVIFGGDSIWLTALEFRQSAGRAGRRGFDDLGNVVFLGISLGKIRRLISSKLPSLIGHFPITTSLVLRLFTLLHESNGSEHAKKSINALLSQPRLFIGGNTFREQVLHHVRFSIEFLRRQRLIGPGGEPINFSRLTGYLYYTEDSSFAFHALLNAGFFHSLCAEISERPLTTCKKLMHVLAYLFCRQPCQGEDVPRLPPLPPAAAAILEEHNKRTLEVYTSYVKTFATEYCNDNADNVLPFSHSVCGGIEGPTPIQPLPPTLARSSFVALSGLDDNFTSISDLADSVRAGVFLESAAVPYLETSAETALNSYILDFYRHGEIKTIFRLNEIRRSDIWFLFNDFSLVLATIVTSLTNFVSCESDEDAADAAGLGDIEDFEVNEKVPDVSLERDIMDDWMDEQEEAEVADMVDLRASDPEMIKVLKAFELLKLTFDLKFKAMWA